MSLVADGTAAWQENKPFNKPFTVSGKTYDYNELSKPNVLMVNSSGDLTKNADQYQKILCADHFDGFSPEVFIDLGSAEKDHRLLFIAERGTIMIINDEYSFTNELHLIYLGDGSWGVLYDYSHHHKPKSWFRDLYDSWLEKVTTTLAYMGMIEHSQTYHLSFSRIIADDKPKGLILVKD